MKKWLFKVLVLWSVTAGSVVSAYAYNTNIWSPVQFVKQLFVTPNGEVDMSKATIKINWTDGSIQAKSIEAKSVKVNGLNVATQSYVDDTVSNKKIKIPTCGPHQVLTSPGKDHMTCVSVSQKTDGICGNRQDVCSQWIYVNKPDNGDYDHWNCMGYNGWKDIECKMHKPVDGTCGTAKYSCNKWYLWNTNSTEDTWTWSCNGEYNGTTTNCSVNKYVSKCNSANIGKQNIYGKTCKAWIKQQKHCDKEYHDNYNKTYDCYQRGRNPNARGYDERGDLIRVGDRYCKDGARVTEDDGYRTTKCREQNVTTYEFE